MALLSLREIRLAFGLDQLLDSVDLHVEPGDRACLVGRNGAGKSSLLKILQGEIAPDSGEIVNPNKSRVAYLPQNLPEGISGNVEEIVSSWISKPEHADVGWSSHHVVGKLLSHLGLDAHSDYGELSGGQKRRVLLARALACEPDLLLLDEPTNHLDIDSICWMEEFLLRHCKTILFVTHDRAFLRRMANKIIDLDRGQLAQWECDYDTYLRRKADLLNDEAVNQTRFDKKLSKEEVWIRKGIKARRTRNEGRVRKLMAMREERRERRSVEGNARLNLQQAERSGRKVIVAENLTFSYGGAHPIVADFSSLIMRGDRIGVAGPNGSGKTTLLKLLTGELQPESGTVDLGTKLEVSYFDQHRAILDDELSVAENVAGGNENVNVNGRPRHVISYLQDFLFTPERAKTPVKVLSGGERSRLLLAMLFAKPSNLLVMDEPTNDLDSETLELLEEQLLNYEGTVLMVSHDREFLDNVVTRLIVMKYGNAAREYVGGYRDYLAETQAAKATVRTTAKKERAKKPSPSKRFGFNEKRELEKLPAKIEQLEAEQAELHDEMASAEYYRKKPEELAADQNRTIELIDELAKLYDRWEELELLRDGG